MAAAASQARFLALLLWCPGWLAHGSLPGGPHKLAQYLGLPGVSGGQPGSFFQCPESPGVESMVGLYAASETQEQAWLGPTTGSGQLFLG